MSDTPSVTVCLAQPSYGSVTGGAARGFWLASLGRAKLPSGEHAVLVDRKYQEISLLACNFNALWCWALNKRHHGHKVDYFAMLHADVEPEDGWLDRLIEEMEAKDLDVLGAVVPIKDQKGLTSIAVQRPDGDTWRPLCRLMMREVYRLPETFTARDVGHPILLNTGCWVCRFDPKWTTDVHFTVNDRIVFSKPANAYCVEVEPEDWFFSRLCNEMGLKIGATRRVKVTHRGQFGYDNEHPWGTRDVDTEYVKESILPEGQGSADWFPSDVDGWLDRAEGEALRELASGKMVLEIGTYCGRSTICMAQSAAGVVTVDPHDGRGTPRPKDTLRECKENLARYGVADRVRVIQKESRDLLSSTPGRFDLVFIDGAHDAASVRTDIEVALYNLKPDGVVAFHDFRDYPGQHDSGWDPDVTDAVKEFIASGARIVSRSRTVAALKPPAREAVTA